MKKKENLLFGLDLAGISEEGDKSQNNVSKANGEKKKAYLAARKSIVESIRSTLHGSDAKKSSMQNTAIKQLSPPRMSQPNGSSFNNYKISQANLQSAEPLRQVQNTKSTGSFGNYQLGVVSQNNLIPAP